ncbi:hypothetical protein HOLleu_09160 [Holothuria leucospilota]|uniref:Uncharacterized protein n=1 Tax=Holothuria leucospilota TaxID=206669 RepID=A0A9Q1CIK2_HOLLE|nr:hypothetical protein HOLleu_09160 [Holothuria leucospilota]
MNGSVQMELITPNGGMMRHSYGIDNTGYTLHEQDVDSDSWEDSADDESVIERNKEINEGVLVKDVLLVMGEGDPRFGFSFIGGVDEGLPPTVDEMLPGKEACYKVLKRPAATAVILMHTSPSLHLPTPSP